MGFPFDLTPFDTLSAAERDRLRESARPIRFAADSLVQDAQAPAAHGYLLVQGHVRQSEGEGATDHHAPQLLGMRALLGGRGGACLRALDDVIAWQIPRDALLDCLNANPAFANALFTLLAARGGAGQRRDREFLSLMMAPVTEAYIRKPHYVDGALDLVTVCRELADQGITNTLVRDVSGGVERIGMFTTTDLRDALLQPVPPDRLPVASVARFDLISIGADAALYDALLMMIRHRVHRILVRDGNRIVGVLGQLDLMGFVSNHSHLIALQVEQARSIDDLRLAAAQMDSLVEVLEGGGARIEVIAGLVSELNTQIFARLWTLLAPPELLANSCLLVMGSEGRGEQILKTDQDNALLLRDGFQHPELALIADRFTATLLEFGYPRCPGNIMLSNPAWRQDQSAFRESLRQWLYGASAEGPMQLAIFMDARAVAGDAALLEQARAHLHTIASGSDALLARFAAAVDQFSEPAGWWARLTALRERETPPLDLKKLGIFPIVHGLRAMALQHRLGEVGSTARIRALVAQGHLDEALGRDLTDALHFLMGLRLRHNLQQRKLQLPADNLVQITSLGLLERDMLKDALAITRRLRQHLRQHFRFDTL